MRYFATLNPSTNVCDGILAVSEEEYNANVEHGYTYENDYCIAIDSYNESLIYRKKYINGEWVDATPDEAALYDAHHTKCHGKWLDELTGNTDNLNTIDKTSLVAAVNECFQNACNGKVAIANAITGVNSSVTIPENPTFAQLAELIGQLGGLQSATGAVTDFTTPESITGNTGFKPKLVVIYNYGTGIANVNIGLFVSSELIGTQISDSVYGLGGTLSRYSYPFTVTDNGFSFSNHGAATNLKWLALG